MTGEEIIEALKEKEELDPHKHDGSYELVKKTVELLGQTDKENIDYKDLNMLYIMTIGTWASGFENKKEKVRESNLNHNDKDKLINLIDEIKQKCENNEYENHSGKEVGMFGTGFFSFKRGENFPSKTEVKKIIRMCNEILQEDDEEKCIEIIENNLNVDITGLGAASISQILHCIKPFYFPILNDKGISLYEKMGLDLIKPKKITTYTENVKKIKEFRDENFNFKNYRVIDLFVIEEFIDKEEKNQKDNSDIKYWRIIAGKHGDQWDNFIKGNYIGIGWPNINYKQGNVIEQIEKSYPDRANPELLKKWFNYFVEDMEIGDIVVVYGNGKFIIGKINSEYYQEPDEHFKNRRKVEWLTKPLEAKKFGENFYNVLKHQYTVLPIKDKSFIEIINNLISDINNKRKNEVEKNNINYFWITAKPEIWSVDNIREGGEVFYTAYNKKGNKRRIFSAFEEAKSGDKVIFYESTPKKAVVATGEITEGWHTEEENGKLIEGVSVKYGRRVEPIFWNEITAIEELEDSKPVKNRAQGSLFKLDKEEYENILALEEVREEKRKIKIPEVNFNINIKIRNLYFQERDKKILLKQLETNLKNGKHIILTGPPGTGKSKLAKEVCKNYVNNYSMVTASSDWSTFDTIGGYKPDKENNLLFSEGVFLECFKNKEKPDNKWLIIDEINRADIDKAFGSLFSALTGDKITLSFKAGNNNNIEIIPEGIEGSEVIPEEHKYIIPEDWRIIATMNTFDKTSLYEMSYAFMRRFAFIPVSIPKDITEDLVSNYLNYWETEINKEYISNVTALWRKINSTRKIGPAIVEDIYKYLTHTKDDYTSPIINYVLPQFEGVREDKINQFLNSIDGLDFLDTEDIELIKEFTDDYFRLGGRIFDS